MKIEEKILQIVKEMGNVIVILQGFDVSELPKKKKYFSFNIEFFDKVDIKASEEIVIEEILNQRQFTDEYKWMTIEEYQLYKTSEKISKMPVAILTNNLYDKQFPFRNTLSNIENIYHYLYYQEDTELDSSQEQLLKNISYFYGKIDYSKQSGFYYVTYPEVSRDIPIYKFYEEEKFPINITESFQTENLKHIELSEEEIPFLDLESVILNSEEKMDIVFVLSSGIEELPNRYLERISILRKIKKITLFFTEPSIKRKIIENEQVYIEILKDIYHFTQFKEIPFYKNIQSHSREVVNISQAQIIDDIVTQAENAIQGETFRDIYVTATTGAGKSVMFQIPALYLSKKYFNDKPLTLVISPLIGLMNDQVANMKKKGVHTSATINGNTPPFEKEQILEKVQKQKIDVLYLSPETLQARSDIKMLIGDRNIGMVIIDEAHIVTTWGKSFRADYWYLGIYLARLRKAYKFPIITFTATAIYGGREDMYLDTRNSLNMINPISYFGCVRRKDIIMNVRSSDKELDLEGRDYRKTKNALALKHLKKAYQKKQKSLLYFPTVRLLMDFYNFLSQNDQVIASVTGKYYGTLKKEEKDETLLGFKTGEIQFVLATKAFGMGIDIPDITNVYHYAPTGNVVDYIQEIGRAARDNTKVKYGFGVIDFLDKDMNEVKQLHGMSAIKKTQILEVMKKILSVYKEKGYNRNLIISPEDFKYIFVENNRDEDTLDNKVKTVLLMIEKDFSSPNKLGYSPFVARPRSLFGNDLILVTESFEKKLIKSSLNSFVKKQIEIEGSNYNAVYQVNLSGIWEKYYKKMSYPSFKFALFNADEREKLTKHKSLFEKFIYTSGIAVTPCKDISIKNIVSQYRLILRSFEAFISKCKMLDKQFTVIDLGNHFMSSLKISDKFEARAFAQTVINSAFEFSKIKDVKFIAERSNSEVNNQRYIIHQDADIYKEFILKNLDYALHPSDNYVIQKDTIISYYYRSKNDPVIDARIAALGIGEARKLLGYQILGGNNPQIYLRMNSVYPLERAIKQGDAYKNSILTDVHVKHYTSVEMLKYLFTKKQEKMASKDRILKYTEWFWNNIEDYFMGILPDEVKDEFSKS